MNLDRIPAQPPMTDAMAGNYLETLRTRLATPRPGDTRTCPDCGRPQHYTGTELGWCHDALIDTWHCAGEHVRANKTSERGA